MEALRDTIFNSQLEQRIFRWYRAIFSIQEIEDNKILQWVFGATILSHLMAFNSWSSSHATTVDSFLNGTYLCRPFFQGCGEWLFLRALPEGYSQSFLYMMLYASLVFAVYCMYRKDWVLAHVALVPSFVWHTLVVFVLADQMAGNYAYYLFVFSTVLLFLPHKEFFLKLAVVFLYFLSTASKMHESWIAGTYFSSLELGLPLFPKWSIPFFTNLVIFMEMVGAWFLLSRRVVLQRAALAFFVAFHLYSGILVEFRYPVTVLPTLVILFGPMYRVSAIPVDRKSIAGWLLILIMFVAQSLPVFIPGDEKLTLEGNKYGLYMFEANHQCVSHTITYFKDGTTKEETIESRSARLRCDPYRGWSRLRSLCERVDSIDRIEWRFDHSINGHAFLRIVDVPDACVLSYNPLGRNTWIRTEKDAAPIGYPVENIYH